ncbi:RICIN domain-containing protein [Streptomyces sp. NPDC099050]|uniref:RICIN domain-containing protein n=1 Tax=Streptomyces sp. NPDC099050 TaxID=3366100 RepID=UPI003801F454
MSKIRSSAIFGGTLATAVAFALVPAPASADIVDQFRNTHSGKCLEVGGWNLNDGATVNQWTCHGGANQKWRYSTSSKTIVNLHSGKCLEPGGWSTSNGSGANQWACHGGANQKWDLWSDGAGHLMYQNVNSGKFLEVGGWSLHDGAGVNQWAYTGGANQKWNG